MLIVEKGDPRIVNCTDSCLICIIAKYINSVNSFDSPSRKCLGFLVFPCKGKLEVMLFVTIPSPVHVFTSWRNLEQMHA